MNLNPSSCHKSGNSFDETIGSFTKQMLKIDLITFLFLAKFEIYLDLFDSFNIHVAKIASISTINRDPQ